MANFARVLAAIDQGGSSVGTTARQPAPRDRARLRSVVPSAFRHDARYYLEVLRVPSLDPAIFDTRVTIETPDVVEHAFSGGPVIFASAHFGPIELPALYLAHRSGKTFVAPMETVDDPPLQAWFEETRGSLGVRIVGLRAARRALQSELEAGGAVGIVADRDIAGGGIEVPFFGHPAPFPVGPALLAIQTGARIYAVGIRRMPGGRLAGGLRHVPVATEGSRRDRITATLTALAAAFEAFIVEAPEQWSGAFFSIWPNWPPSTEATGRVNPTATPAKAADSAEGGDRTAERPPA
jgi:KDO2-lipid IV(A) lauroyltransferase